jgi:hypothetical protein
MRNAVDQQRAQQGSIDFVRPDDLQQRMSIADRGDEQSVPKLERHQQFEGIADMSGLRGA